ncbi:MAG TPA: fumarylacetoacetate hydrolase family protein [Terriglobales bacterium]|nr:fumarylacetoacetate hydrolase family protein [Terriglobales bacterium]
MRYCRFELEGAATYGLIESVGGVETITRKVTWQTSGEAETSPLESPLALETAVLLAPVEPSKILCVGRNYREHASELGNEVPKEPLIFLKPPSSVIGPGATIEIPSEKLTQRVDFEGEVGVVIGQRCRNLRADEDVRAFIRGYTCVNDVTARDLQKKDGQWARAKGFDTFCPVGPLVTDDIDIWKGVDVTTMLNGEPRQRGNTTEFLFDLAAVMRYISAFCTLEPGDLISTGTPAGVGPMKPRDVVEVSVAGIGTLRNVVA